MTDLTTAIPYDLLGVVFGSWNMLRIPKLFMAFKFPYYVTRMKAHLERHKIFVSVDVTMTINISIIAIVFTHWIACSWAMIFQPEEPNLGLTSAYYWTLTTITSVGFGDITPLDPQGRWFAASMMIIGSMLTAGVIANITSMAHKVVISEDNAQHVMTCVEKYMVEKELPFDLRERCLRYFNTLKGDINEEKILVELVPPPFLPDIALHIYSALLNETVLFISSARVDEFTKSAKPTISQGFIRSVGMLLKEEVVVEGEWIVKDNPDHNR